MRTKIFLTTILLFVGLISNAQDDGNFSDAVDNYTGNTKQINITPDLYFFQADNENMGIFINENGVLLIDTQNDEEMPRSIKLINKKSKKKPIVYLVNTSSKAKNFKAYNQLRKDGTLILSNKLKVKKGEEAKLKGSVSSNSDIIYSDDLILNFSDEEVKIYPIKGSGNSIVHLTKRNVIFTGEPFLGKKYPAINAENGDSFEDVQKIMARVLIVANDKTKIIPGKGGIIKLNDLTNANKMMETVVKQIFIQRENGKTLEQVLAMKNITKNYDANGYGNGAVTTKMFITSIYNEIAIKSGPLDTRTPEEKAMARLKEMQKDKKGTEKSAEERTKEALKEREKKNN